MIVKGLHHMALRCKDANQSIHFYRDVLGLELVAAVGDDHVGSTREFSPHLNLFFKMGDGSMLDLIDVPLSPPAETDKNTPAWVQHLALSVDSMDDLLEMKKRVEDAGIDVIGPTDHHMCQSIYFFDPSGHRLEFAWQNNPAALTSMTEKVSTSLTNWEEKKAKGWQKAT